MGIQVMGFMICWRLVRGSQMLSKRGIRYRRLRYLATDRTAAHGFLLKALPGFEAAPGKAREKQLDTLSMVQRRSAFTQAGPLGHPGFHGGSLTSNVWSGHETESFPFHSRRTRDTQSFLLGFIRLAVPQPDSDLFTIRRSYTATVPHTVAYMS